MEHSPYFRTVPQAHTAVLLIHGIVGTPRHFDPLMDLLPESWTVHNILLDGHGGGVRDFSKTSMKKWRAQVASQLQQLCAAHSRVLLVGHSMGTLLAMEAASMFPQVKSLFLLNPPLRPWVRFSMAIRSLKLVFGKLPPQDNLHGASGVTTDRRLWRYLGWLGNFWQLLCLCRKSRKSIQHLQIPSWAFLSEKDELVSLRSEKYLKGHPCIRYQRLSRSGHFAYETEDLTLLRQALQGCIEEL